MSLFFANRVFLPGVWSALSNSLRSLPALTRLVSETPDRHATQLQRNPYGRSLWLRLSVSKSSGMYVVRIYNESVALKPDPGFVVQPSTRRFLLLPTSSPS